MQNSTTISMTSFLTHFSKQTIQGDAMDIFYPEIIIKNIEGREREFIIKNIRLSTPVWTILMKITQCHMHNVCFASHCKPLRAWIWHIFEELSIAFHSALKKNHFCGLSFISFKLQNSTLANLFPRASTDEIKKGRPSIRKRLKTGQLSLLTGCPVPYLPLSPVAGAHHQLWIYKQSFIMYA